MLINIALLALIATSLLLSSSLSAQVLPSGTEIETRLSVASGSGISRPGNRVSGVIIAPVLDHGDLLIPQGATISGTIQSVQRLGLGLKHMTAAIDYRFDTIRLQDGTAIPIEARVSQVEAAKERVNANGLIGGIYPTANLSSTASYYVLPLLCVDPAFGVPVLAVKFLIARSPDPEIYFPAGTEMILQLTRPANVPDRVTLLDNVPQLSPADLAEAHHLLKELPHQRTSRERDHPSDLVNILFFGTRDQINRAFHAAGWAGAQRRSLMSIYGMYHCMVQRIGYSTAPMGKLTLNGLYADLDYQKGLDTFSKRHHLRLWEQQQPEAWFSAATEDVGYTFRKAHLTHATDARIDNERSKVLNDLAFTGCLEAATLMQRDSPYLDDERGPSIITDGKLVVMRMNDCRQPHTMAGVSDKSRLAKRVRWVKALAALRNDVIRCNPVSLAVNTTRMLSLNRSALLNGSMSIFNSNGHKTGKSVANPALQWNRPSVLDAAYSPDHPRF